LPVIRLNRPVERKRRDTHAASLARISGERSEAAATSIALARARFGRALRRPHNWVQLAKFCTVGATGYVVNLSVYTALLLGAGVDYRLAATCSFLVAVTNNYTWNRVWTFRGQRGHVAYQGMRFLVVSVLAYLGNLIWLTALVSLGMHKVLAQAIAIILVTPFNFAGNKLWSFRREG
jgi:putative flippase GtrA